MLPDRGGQTLWRLQQVLIAQQNRAAGYQRDEKFSDGNVKAYGRDGEEAIRLAKSDQITEGAKKTD